LELFVLLHPRGESRKVLYFTFLQLAPQAEDRAGPRAGAGSAAADLCRKQCESRCILNWQVVGSFCRWDFSLSSLAS